MNFDSWLDTPILGNAAGHWLTALGGALGATAMILGLRTMARRRLAGLAAQTDTIADDLVIEAIGSVKKTYILLISIGVALAWLSFPLTVHVTIKRVMILVAVLQGIVTGTAIVDFLAAHYAAAKEGLDRTTLRALGYAGRVVLWVTAILVGLEAAGFQVQTLLTGLGVGGIAIALAVQNILGDLFAALSIVLDKPFVVGDAIAVDQFEGEVAHVGLKSTRVRSVNGEEVVFANTDLLKTRLRNLSRRQGRRYLLTLTVAPSTPAERVARVPGIVKAAVAAEGRATLQRSHLIAAGLNGPEIETSIIIPGLDYIAAHDIRQAILLGILAGLEREGIVLARSAHIASA
jgi:small-conductance mechanosensitive channel